jgi:hypothetical protein
MGIAGGTTKVLYLRDVGTSGKKLGATPDRRCLRLVLSAMLLTACRPAVYQTPPFDSACQYGCEAWTNCTVCKSPPNAKPIR